MTTNSNSDPGFDPTEYVDPDPRLPRGQLTLDVYNICLDFSKKNISLEEGRYMTSYVVTRIIMDENNGRPKPPSTGAVAAVFRRWEEWGFATFRKNPFAFIDFTEHGKEVGLSGVLAERAEIKRSAQALYSRPREQPREQSYAAEQAEIIARTGA